jgi:hypothetical protein
VVHCVFFRDPDGNLLELIDVAGDAETISDLSK